MAGAEGFEPPMPGPKPGALPLGYAPTNNFFFSEIIPLLLFALFFQIPG